MKLHPHNALQELAVRSPFLTALKTGAPVDPAAPTMHSRTFCAQSHTHNLVAHGPQRPTESRQFSSRPPSQKHPRQTTALTRQLQILVSVRRLFHYLHIDMTALEQNCRIIVEAAGEVSAAQTPSYV